MTRQRDIPSNQYRSQNQINITLPKRNGVDRYDLVGAARLNDAYGPVMGTSGFGALPILSVLNGGDFRSQSIQNRGLPGIEESGRGLTRAVFDPNDYATPMDPGASYLPNDDATLFLRVIAQNTTGAPSPAGPILVIPPYDFFSTKEPVFTVTAQAPNLGIGVFPPNIPDTLIPGVLNFLVPAYGTTISIRNLDPLVGGFPLFVSFHPGTPPTVLMPGDDISLTGAGAPEFFMASPNGNPWFTLRIAVVNSA